MCVTGCTHWSNMEAIMTYDPNDPATRRPPMGDEATSYTGWIIGGVVALVVILGIFMMTGRTDNMGTASNPSPATASRPATTPPATTGFGGSTAPADSQNR
jgi:hypothetical protein